MPVLRSRRQVRRLPSTQELRHALAVPAEQQGHGGPSAVLRLRLSVVDRHASTRAATAPRGLSTNRPLRDAAIADAAALLPAEVASGPAPPSAVARSARPRRVTAYAVSTASGFDSGSTLTPLLVGRPIGNRPTPKPATIRSSTRSRLSISWAMRGANPASAASVRTAVSSAVLRELTIQVWSAYAAMSAGPSGNSSGTAEAPRDRPQRLGLKHRVGGGGRQVVVVGERQIEVVVGQAARRPRSARTR